MNWTVDYNDELDGPHLACKPGDAAEGFEDACSWGMSIIGSVAFLNGMYCFYLVHIKRRHWKLLTMYKRDAANDMPNVQSSPKLGVETFSKMEKLLLSAGVMHVSLSLMFLVYGFGTMYPTTHIRGQIGDAIGKKERN